MVMDKKEMLNNLQDIRTYIYHDITRNKQKKSRSRSRRQLGGERNNGKGVKMGFSKVWINQELWIWNNSKQIIENWKDGEEQEGKLDATQRRDSKT